MTITKNRSTAGSRPAQPPMRDSFHSPEYLLSQVLLLLVFLLALPVALCLLVPVLLLSLLLYPSPRSRHRSF